MGVCVLVYSTVLSSPWLSTEKYPHIYVCVCVHTCSYPCVCVLPQRNWLVAAKTWPAPGTGKALYILAHMLPLTLLGACQELIFQTDTVVGNGCSCDWRRHCATSTFDNAIIFIVFLSICLLSSHICAFLLGCYESFSFYLVILNSIILCQTSVISTYAAKGSAMESLSIVTKNTQKASISTPGASYSDHEKSCTGMYSKLRRTKKYACNLD